MTRDADLAKVPDVPLCPLCGAPTQPDVRCDFDRPEGDSPAAGDYTAMHEGRMTHAEHLLVVARWLMHDEAMQKPSVTARYRPVVLEGWGRPQRLFPLEG